MRPYCISSVLLLLASCVSMTSATYKVPLEKAAEPKMDPIPMLPAITQRVFMDIEVDGKSIGRIVFGLFGGIAPKAAENFIAMCLCDHGVGKQSGKQLCYKHSKIHRVIPNFAFQGGDHVHGDGTGMETIYGELFQDESFEVKHNRRYMLNAVNAGKKNTNGSQWFVSTVKTQWLDGKYVIFGMVLEGMRVMNKIESLGSYSGIPSAEIVVANSGSLPAKDGDETPRLVSWKLKK
mmetsp:Transcript_18911/g.52565  ORF Transcript_18911/g.52565 Transcript_18911/m.52565 type:complete len:235 (-) Transcript_18911:282-986(-)